MRKFTAERLSKVVEAIDPRHFDMERWIDAWEQNGASIPIFGPAHVEKALEYLKPEHLKPCGTVACLAGWTCAVFPPRKRGGNEGAYIPEYAATRLGLTEDESDRLFHVNNWPPPYRGRYNKVKSGRGKLDVLKDRVAHFIVTGA